jgi:hypothetical protein
MSNLTYDQHCVRDRLVVSTVRDIVDSVEYNNGEMTVWDDARFSDGVRHLSDEARRQVTEEVRQVLLLLEKLNKKRVM